MNYRKVNYYLLGNRHPSLNRSLQKGDIIVVCSIGVKSRLAYKTKNGNFQLLYNEWLSEPTKLEIVEYLLLKIEHTLRKIQICETDNLKMLHTIGVMLNKLYRLKHKNDATTK